jgi:hypothetical protein
MSRRLTAGETALARSMFGDAIDYGRVRIWTRPWGRPAVTLWSQVTFPASRPPPADFALAAPSDQAWLIHELTHVWQFQTKPWRTVLSWVRTLVSGGYGHGQPGYRYAFPFAPWPGLNLEQQASMVEHAYLIREGRRCTAAPAGATFEAYCTCLPLTLAPRGNPAGTRIAARPPAASDSGRTPLA